MTKSSKTIEFKFERTIPAPPGEVYDAWLDPKVHGNPWNAAEKFLLNPKVDGTLLLGTQGDCSLWPIHCHRAAGPHSAYLGVTKHLRTRVDRNFDI